MYRLRDEPDFPPLVRAIVWKVPDVPGVVLRLELYAPGDLSLATVTCVGTALCQDAIVADGCFRSLTRG
jgi:hypothetical protein